MSTTYAPSKQSAEIERLSYCIGLFGRLSEQARREILAKVQNEMREQEAEDAKRALTQLTVRS